MTIIPESTPPVAENPPETTRPAYTEERWPPAIPETPGQVMWEFTTARIWKITVNLDDMDDHFIEVEHYEGEVRAGEQTGSGLHIDAAGARSLVIVMDWLEERGTMMRR